MFEPFQNFIPRAAKRYGVSKETTAAQICNDFRLLMPEIFKDKENLDQCLQPAFYKNDILVINVKTPAWAQEVIMRKAKIIDAMNTKAGKEVIKNLRTKLGLDA